KPLTWKLSSVRFSLGSTRSAGDSDASFRAASRNCCTSATTVRERAKEALVSNRLTSTVPRDTSVRVGAFVIGRARSREEVLGRARIERLPERRQVGRRISLEQPHGVVEPLVPALLLPHLSRRDTEEQAIEPG